MNSSTTQKHKIKDSLNAFSKDNYLTAGEKFIDTILGHKLGSAEEPSAMTPDQFINKYLGIKYQNNDIGQQAKQKDNDFIRKHTSAININRKIDSDVIANTIADNSDIEFNNDKSIYGYFYFFIVQMKNATNKKTSYTRLTRIISRRLNNPTVILFCDQVENNTHVHLSLIERRPDKQAKELDVISQKVSMLYAINCKSPHSGDLSLLSDLALLKLADNLEKEDLHFDVLVNKWLEILSIETLNNKFYNELLVWFTDITSNKEVKFPLEYQYIHIENGQEKLEKKNIKREEQVIRLITRFMFIWFIKEKNLVPKELFDERTVFKAGMGDYQEISPLLNKEYTDGDDNYYRAILQNLFFATLNTPIEDKVEGTKREFSKEDGSTHRVFSKWRYKEEINDPKGFAELMNKVPFINGGLFDCLDGFYGKKEGKEQGTYRLDCFTDNAHQRKKLFVPNWIFFDKKRGLLEIFKEYKFTVEENTAIDIDVALDPELLGNVFERLIAFYNPETHDGEVKSIKDSKRAKSGSYYTRRHVVDFMVNGALKEYLKNNLKQNACKITDKELTSLLTLTDEGVNLSEEKINILISAVYNLKALDPAVGSGAFPMEVLRQCVGILSKLDPDNKKWKQEQLYNLPSVQSIKRDYILTEQMEDKKAQKKAQEELDNRTQEIRSNFGLQKHDYLRKLYLIRNSIYGVDIQPIACQITKLRFFISLTIDQEISRNGYNLGIQSLPNLETNFVAADSLIKLYESKSNQAEFDTEMSEVKNINTEIKLNRNNIFSANSRKKKRILMEKDKHLRNKLGKVMRQEYKALYKGEDTGLKHKPIKNREIEKILSNIDKITSHNIMDQNFVANWFDPDWMFGINDKFDIVIGNPPYIQLQNNKGELANRYKDAGFESLARRGDIYMLFYEKAISLLKQGGILSFITSNKWMRNDYGNKLREFFVKNITPISVIDLGPGVFERVTVWTNILISHKKEPQTGINFPAFRVADSEDRDTDLYKCLDSPDYVSLDPAGDKWIIVSDEESNLQQKIEETAIPLNQHNIQLYRGVTTGENDAFTINEEIKDRIIAEDPNSAKIIQPLLRGKNIKKWYLDGDKEWLIATLPVLQIDIDDYPAVKKYLLDFGMEKLVQSGETEKGARGKTIYDWFEVSSPMTNYQNFSNDKIIFATLVQEPNIYYDTQGYYSLDSTFTINGKSAKYLAAVLNSRFTHEIFSRFYAGGNVGGEGVSYKKAYIKDLRIPDISAEEQKPFNLLVDKIVELTKDRYKVDKPAIKAVQSEIDKLVAEIYQLTPAEIKLLTPEKSTPPGIK